MSDSVQPHRWQSTRLPRPWDSPGKNTGVGCHFILQCMKVKSESEVTQSCSTLSNPMDCSLPGSSVHGILQAGVGCHCLLQAKRHYLHLIKHAIVLFHLTSAFLYYYIYQDGMDGSSQGFICFL